MRRTIAECISFWDALSEKHRKQLEDNTIFRSYRRGENVIFKTVKKDGIIFVLGGELRVYLAFVGQFADTPRDTVFTTEYSIRTGMEAVYTLCNVDRGVPEVWGSVYDVRDLLYATSKLLDGKKPAEFLLPSIMPLLGLLKEPLTNNVVVDLLKKYDIV